MKLNHGHLAYCTNIHRGESWTETFAALQTHTLAVRDRVSPGAPYAIGLRLSDLAARELSDPSTLDAFRRWLDREQCYVFTINGFPYGQFHGTRVKEQVYAPDWTTDARVDYTNRLFDLLVHLLPAGVSGSVSTVPASFKDFITSPEQVAAMRRNLWRSVDHIAALSERTGRDLHLGLEPEPLCYLETSTETARFFEELRADRPHDPRLQQHLGVNYDACHLAVEFESPGEAIGRLRRHGIRISKLHFSSALKVRVSDESLAALRAFAEDIYFHQTIERGPDGTLRRFRDLDAALADATGRPPAAGTEWRIHFHIPLHARPSAWFDTTTDHLLGVLDFLAADPSMCSHFEMETYTWEVLPPGLKKRDVVEQLVGEYGWTLDRLRERGFTPAATTPPG